MLDGYDSTIRKVSREMGCKWPRGYLPRAQAVGGHASDRVAVTCLMTHGSPTVASAMARALVDKLGFKPGTYVRCDADNPLNTGLTVITIEPLGRPLS